MGLDNHEIEQMTPKLQDITYYNKYQSVLARKPARSTEKIGNGHLG